VKNLYVTTIRVCCKGRRKSCVFIEEVTIWVEIITKTMAKPCDSFMIEFG